MILITTRAKDVNMMRMLSFRRYVCGFCVNSQTLGV